MAVRPIFLPKCTVPYWSSVDVSFEWFPGFSVAQKRKSIRALHEAALNSVPVSRILEVSSKSDTEMGVALSAFNLKVKHLDLGIIPLESAFQGSKYFCESGQLSRSYRLDPRSAKAASRETDAFDTLLGFRWGDKEWPLEPKSWFYDWLYISAVLYSLPEATEQLRHFDAFTDIEFNSKTSFNCQARSCAIIASTESDHELRALIEKPELMVERQSEHVPNQARLF